MKIAHRRQNVCVTLSMERHSNDSTKRAGLHYKPIELLRLFAFSDAFSVLSRCLLGSRCNDRTLMTVDSKPTGMQRIANQSRQFCVKRKTKCV